MTTRAYAVTSAAAPFAPLAIERRDPLPRDVVIEILYCGICHSDLHIARNEWGGTQYPCVPGHEIVGRVKAVGSDVTRFKAGDLAAVGCMVDSCRQCTSCREQMEQFCLNGTTFTYNSEDKHSGGMTYGGYSEAIVVDEAFVLRVPESLDLAQTAPLLCAGITTYSPLRRWEVGPGQRVGVVGLGGLGHMGLKFASSFGAETVLFTTSATKVEDGKRLGADEVVISRDESAMEEQKRSFDFILDTVSAEHDINAYLSLLKLDGTLVLVGAPPNPLQVGAFSLISSRRKLAGSLIGGIAETQQMLNYCGERGIGCDVEIIAVEQVDEAYERMLRSDVKYRFVIDMASIKR